MNPKEKAHPFFYVLTMQKIYISRLSVTTKKSRTPPVPRPLGAMAKAKLAKQDAAHHLEEDRTKNDLGTD